MSRDTTIPQFTISSHSVHNTWVYPTFLYADHGMCFVNLLELQHVGGTVEAGPHDGGWMMRAHLYFAEPHATAAADHSLAQHIVGQDEEDYEATGPERTRREEGEE